MFTEKMKAQAQTRMWVKWKNPINDYESMIYYSYETAKSLREKDKPYGMIKLEKLAKSPSMILKIDIAIIYDNINNKELRRFINS